MENAVDALRDDGLAANLKIMLCEGQIDDTVRKYFGANAHGAEWLVAVALSKQWIKGK